MKRFQTDLVSLITPCFNTGAYVHRLLDSVLSQTYPHIEMIVVDDGSTDNSAEIIKSYIPAFAAKGYTLRYVWQENSGQSVAIQNALEMVNGEYLAWPDSDDYYAADNAIERMVERLASSSEEVGMVRTQERMVSDENEGKTFALFGENVLPIEDKSLYWDCMLKQNDFYYCAGAYMIRTAALFECSLLPIYTSKDAGQNWQLMLPILYHYRCASIAEPLYNVVMRSSSHSRAGMNYESRKKRIQTYHKTLLETIKRIKNISSADLIESEKMVTNKYTKLYFSLAVNAPDRKDAKEMRKELKQMGLSASSRDIILYFLLKFKLYQIVVLLRKIKNLRK